MQPFLSLCLAASLASTAWAQTGTLDQVSPNDSTNWAWFNGTTPGTVWQAQVRVGLPGQLEGFKLRLSGSAGAQVNVRVRLSGGWSTNGVVFSSLLTKSVSVDESVFVDLTSASIVQSVGDLFVIELEGNNTNCGMKGTYYAPPSAPAYPEPLFFSGSSGCYTDCGWRIAFETYVLVPPTFTTYCTAGTTTNSCVPSLSASGTADAYSGSGFEITASGVEGQKQGLLFYGITGAQASPWSTTSTSFMCVQPPTQRMSVHGSGGTIGQCDGVLSEDWNTFVWSNQGALGQPFVIGEQVWVQGWFRDPPAPKTTNLTNGLSFTL